MRQLIAALAHLAVLFKQAIHGANRAVILAFIEQRHINSGWRAILEAFFVQTRQDRVSFRWAECACGRRPRERYGGGRSLTALPLVKSPPHPQSLTNPPGAPPAPPVRDPRP